MNQSMEQLWKDSGKIKKTEILGEKPVAVPLTLKLPKGTEDNHKKLVSQYKCTYAPPHKCGYQAIAGRDIGEKICQTLTAYPSRGNYTMTSSEEVHLRCYSFKT